MDRETRGTERQTDRERPRERASLTHCVESAESLLKWSVRLYSISQGTDPEVPPVSVTQTIHTGKINIEMIT